MIRWVCGCVHLAVVAAGMVMFLEFHAEVKQTATMEP